MSKKYSFAKFMFGAALAAGAAYLVKKAVDDGDIGPTDPSIYGYWREKDTGCVWDFGPNGLMEVNGKVCRYTARRGILDLKEADDAEDLSYTYSLDGDELVIKDSATGADMRFVLDDSAQDE